MTDPHPPSLLSRRIASSTAGWPVYGHDWVVEYLQRVVQTDRVGVDGEAAQRRQTETRLRHAYLFVGPPQVGKSTVVRALAKALLCTGDYGTKADGESTGDAASMPCGVCRSCRLMDKGMHPDFRILSPTDRDGLADRVNGSLRVAASEELIHDASLRPVEGTYKVFHIQDAHLAELEFSHKILKTLEEPPAHVIICVSATDRSELLPTIVSRCEVLELRPVPSVAAKHALMAGWQAESERAELLARLSGGRLGWAVRQLEDSEDAARRLEMLEDLQRLVAASRIERLRFAEKASTNRNDQHLFGMLELWTIWWRDVLLAQHGCADAISNLDQQSQVEQHARSLPAPAVERHLETLRRVERYLHHTVNTRLAMDALLLDMPRQAA